MTAEGSTSGSHVHDPVHVHLFQLRAGVPYAVDQLRCRGCGAVIRQTSRRLAA